ncbi:hypothetical protein [Polaromonas jejuensis]|uniref:Uncharacterized protein n=1 Tax=Polaromonas jejuensis TaxID=457502 RepID=A0ABW0Q692_9BURK|nr:hypothetical protein [Polaromonas jejuensis]
MTEKTSFSFEVQYPAHSAAPQAERDQLMDSLEPSLRSLLAAQDSRASVMVSDSHRGDDNKLVELVTTLDEPQVAKILKAFSEQHGVSVTALE